MKELSYFIGGVKRESQFDCYSYDRCQWNLHTSSKENRRFASLTLLTNFINVIIGGEKDSKNLIDAVTRLDNKKWTIVGRLQEPVSRHCSVQINRDTIYIIGGYNKKATFSQETVSLGTLAWTSAIVGARLKRGRQLHGCAILNSNQIVVAGGRDARGALKSVETLEIRSSNGWIERKNLELPYGISYAQLVTNPEGMFHEDLLIDGQSLKHVGGGGSLCLSQYLWGGGGGT